MDHKRLLSSCVDVLDSFNPRIDGVLEHLNTCLATKLVRKPSLLTQKSVRGLIFNVSCGVNNSRQGRVLLFRLWSANYNLISILILVCSGSCWRRWVLYYRSFLWMCAVCQCSEGLYMYDSWKNTESSWLELSNYSRYFTSFQVVGFSQSLNYSKSSKL